MFLAGQRLKEGGHINKSLLALGSVIAKLSEGERYGKNNSRFTWELRSFRKKFDSLTAFAGTLADLLDDIQHSTTW